MRLRIDAGPARDAGSIGRVNVTPLIDVVMVLIVFFLLVGNLAAERREPVDLPDAPGAVEAGDPGDVVINVTPGPLGVSNLIVAGRLRTEAEIRTIVADASRAAAEAGHPLRVRLRADRALGYGQIRPVVRACVAAGASSVEIATGSPSPVDGAEAPGDEP